MLNKTKISPHIRIALIHDTWTHLGGAERVFRSMCEIFPQADVYIGLLNRSFLAESPLPTSSISTSVFSLWKISEIWLSWFKPLVWLYWKLLNLQAYDLVISSSGSFSAKSVRVSKNATHISYIHTPPKYIWGEENMHSWMRQNPWKILLSPVLKLLRWIDNRDAQQPNLLIANSKYVQQRIKAYYQRNSTVVYPPVDVLSYIAIKRSSHFLFVSRLEKQKGAELVIQTCTALKLPLLVAGTGTQERYLQKIAGPTIQFLGLVSESALNALFASGKVLLYCSKQEDFGLVPVEAMSHGLPVIAYAQGGVLETVKNNVTGILFSNYSQKGLTQAIQKFEKGHWKSTMIRKHARQFSRKNLQKKLINIIVTTLRSRDGYNTV